MKIIKKILLSMFAVLSFTLFTGVANAACGKITIANMNWASANFMAEVDKVILEKGYGCDVELVPGSTMPTFTSMTEKGEPDVAPEFWANAAIIQLNKAVDEGKMHSINKAPITGLGEGWWVLPATLEKHPELTTADAILKRPDLFPHPEDPSKGGFPVNNSKSKTPRFQTSKVLSCPLYLIISGARYSGVPQYVSLLLFSSS